MARHLFVMRCLPYEAGGTPIVIRTLLQFLSATDFIVLGRRVNPAKRISKNEINQRLYSIPMLYIKGHRLWKYLSIIPGFVVGLYVLRRYRINTIIGVFQDDAALILAYLLAVTSKKNKFFPYLMDLYSDQQNGYSKIVSSKLQRVIFKRASKVFVVNDGMSEFYQRKYFLDVATVPIISSQKPQEHSNRMKTTYHVISYSGTINSDRLSTLKRFVAEIKKRKDIVMKFLGPHNLEFFEAHELYDTRFEYKNCRNTDDLYSELENSDILYLPLTFDYDESRRAQLETCFAAKTYEYMRCKVPILIHSPSSFFNYKYLEENEAAICLDKITTSKMNDVLDMMTSRGFKKRAARTVNNANRLALNFDGLKISNYFMELLDQVD